MRKQFSVSKFESKSLENDGRLPSKRRARLPVTRQRANKGGGTRTTWLVEKNSCVWQTMVSVFRSISTKIYDHNA